MIAMETTMAYKMFLLLNLNLDRLPPTDNVESFRFCGIVPVFIPLSGTSSDYVILDT